MKTLYSRWDILAKLRDYLTPYFEGFTKPTTRTLIWITIAMIAVGSVRSVRSLHMEFLTDLDLVSLNCLYHALSYAKRPIKRAFIRVTVQLMLKVIPPGLRSALCFLIVDDTLVPKFGRKFDLVGTLFDHADHDGRPYKNGHCMVCIALSVPVGRNRKSKQIIYLSVPLILKIWEKGGPSKLEIAHDLLLEVKDAAADLTRFVLLMDSWYPSATCSHVKFTKHGRLGRHKEPMTNWQELQ